MNIVSYTYIDGYLFLILLIHDNKTAKKIKFKVINQWEEKRLFLLKKKDNNGVINWESVRNLILSKDDFRDEIFTGLFSNELGNVCNDDDVWNKLCVNTINNQKFIPVFQLYK